MFLTVKDYRKFIDIAENQGETHKVPASSDKKISFGSCKIGRHGKFRKHFITKGC